MGFGSVWHWVIVALVILVLFGRGRISEMMGDLGKGIKSFKQGMNEETDRPASAAPPRIEPPRPAAAVPTSDANPAAHPAPMPVDPVSGAPLQASGQPWAGAPTSDANPAAHPAPMPTDPVSAPPRNGG